jgi:hypothetical protein
MGKWMAMMLLFHNRGAAWPIDILLYIAPFPALWLEIRCIVRAWAYPHVPDAVGPLSFC